MTLTVIFSEIYMHNRLYNCIANLCGFACTLVSLQKKTYLVTQNDHNNTHSHPQFLTIGSSNYCITRVATEVMGLYFSVQTKQKERSSKTHGRGIFLMHNFPVYDRNIVVGFVTAGNVAR